jgi:hypothetical protein
MLWQQGALFTALYSRSSFTCRLQVDKMTRKQLAENPSAGALAIVMDYLGRVGAQDSCGLLCCENEEGREAAAANPSIKFMLEKPRFR